MPTIIVAERPDARDASALIAELEAHLAPLYPAESRHGFSIRITKGSTVFAISGSGTSSALSRASSLTSSLSVNIFAILLQLFHCQGNYVAVAFI